MRARLEKFDAFSRAAISKELVISKKNIAGIALACALIPALTLGGSAAFAVADPELPGAPVSAELAAPGDLESGTGGEGQAETTLELPGADGLRLSEEPLEDPALEPNERAGAAPAEAPAAADTYSASGTITIPAGMKLTNPPMGLVNAAYLAGSNTTGARWVNATLDTATGAWSATGVPSGEYRIWLAANGHQLLPGKVTVAGADVSGLTTELQVTGQATLGFALPTGAKGKIDSISFTNTATGKAVTATVMPNGLGLLSNPFSDLSATGVCQAGGAGELYWCPILAPGNYLLSFGLNNGKTVYYNGKSAQPGVATGTTTKAQASTLKVAASQHLRLQSIDVRSHFAPKPKPTAPTFTDVQQGAPFYADIRWLADSGITTGVKQSNGSYKFLPKDSVTREAMIAFLYRANGVKNYTPKGASPFVDVKKGDQFYTQIMWAYENKVTTGINLGNGKRKFDPKATITREAMAAFMYRQYATSIPVGSAPQNFTDIPANHKFAKEIKWMASNKITTGVKQPNGTVKFVPKGTTSREATAAFLHRAELKK